MGQSIGWYRLGERWKSGGYKTPWADDAPKEFHERFQGRAEWWSAALGCGEQVITCGCCQDGYTYGCDTSSVWRPTDFAAFREAQQKAGLTDEIFVQMTDWLEAHPDVYVDYN